MSIERERTLSPDLIEAFPHALNLDEKAQNEFQAIAQNWLEAKKTHEDASGLHAQRVALIEKGVLEANREAIHAREELEHARRLVGHSQDISIVKGRIREKLHRLEVWPLWVRLVSPLVKKFTGGEPVKIHPYVEQFTKRTQEADMFAKDAKRRFEVEKEGIEKSEQQGIAEAGRNVVAAENKFFGFIGRQIAGSREQTLEVMRMVPEKREFFANIYAKQNIASNQELEHFWSFVQNTPAFKWDKLAPEHKIRWYGRKRAWVEEERAPTPEEYNELPYEEVKRLWLNEVRHRVLADF